MWLRRWSGSGRVFVRWLVGWSVGASVGRLIRWSVRGRVGLSVGWSVFLSVGRFGPGGVLWPGGLPRLLGIFLSATRQCVCDPLLGEGMLDEWIFRWWVGLHWN